MAERLNKNLDRELEDICDEYLRANGLMTANALLHNRPHLTHADLQILMAMASEKAFNVASSQRGSFLTKISTGLRKVLLRLVNRSPEPHQEFSPVKNESAKPVTPIADPQRRMDAYMCISAAIKTLRNDPSNMQKTDWSSEYREADTHTG